MNNSNRPMLAQSLLVSELSGLLAKYLIVPAGYQGLLIDEIGNKKTFSPGRHVVLNLEKSLFGKLSAIKVALLPAGPLTVRLKAENLPNHDRELLDASLICEVEIIDQVRFFQQVVEPEGKIFGNMLDISPEVSWEVLSPIIRQFNSMVLLQDSPIERLLPQILSTTEPVLNSLGLYLDFVRVISFWRSLDRSIATEKAHILQMKLSELKTEEHINQVSTQEDFESLIEKLEPGLLGRVKIEPVFIKSEKIKEETQKAEDGKFSLLENFRIWLNAETNKITKNRHFRISNLFKRGGKNDTPRLRKGRKWPKWWWLPRLLWMMFVFVTAIVITKLVNWISGGAGGDARWEVYLPVWGFAIVAILESLKALFQRREELQNIKWVDPGFTFVDDLVGKDRQKTDELVREQCSQTLLNARDMLNDVRSQVYHAGDEENSLKIRAFEKKIQYSSQQVLDAKIGAPPYVTNLKINKKLWEELLDFDEQLLVRISAFLEDVQDFQQNYSQKKIDIDKLNQLEGRLDAFVHNFKKRSQIPKAPENDLGHYRI